MLCFSASTGKEGNIYVNNAESSMVSMTSKREFLDHHKLNSVGSGGHAVERRTVNRGDGGSVPPTAVSKLRQFLHPTFACVFRKRH